MPRFQKKAPKTQNTKTRTTKLLNYARSYSSAFTDKDGVRNMKGHAEVKNSEMNMVSHRVDGSADLTHVLYLQSSFHLAKREFDAKNQKPGDRKPPGLRIAADQLKQEIGCVYSDLQTRGQR